MTVALEEAAAVVVTAQVVPETTPDVDLRIALCSKTYTPEQLAAVRQLLCPGFLIGPNQVVQMDYEEWLVKAEIPPEFAGLAEMKAMFGRGHPPRWAHHDFFFEMHPELRAAE